jgi:hypothetical protein
MCCLDVFLFGKPDSFPAQKLLMNHILTEDGDRRSSFLVHELLGPTMHLARR